MSDRKQSEWERADRGCHYCNSYDVEYREVESLCGGFVDTKYHCRACDKTWWVDGSDF